MVNQSDSPKEPTVSSKELDDVKTLTAIGYIGILFLVPLLARPKSEFAIFHANQSLLLFIFAIIINTIGGAIPILGWFLILPVGGIFCIVLFVMGLMNALNGTMKRLPLIGKFDILKVQK